MGGDAGAVDQCGSIMTCNSFEQARLSLLAGAFTLLFVGVLGVFAGGCGKQQEAAAPRQPTVSVVVGMVTQKTVPIKISAIGNVEPYSTVSIKAQVAGDMTDVHFKEGDFVHKGQLLLEIDPRPYQDILAQARAALARDKAVALNNRAQAQRYQKLLEAGVVAAQDAESYTSTAEAASALVNADEAAVQTAELNLEFCKIYSPIDGRTGYLMLKPGNLVKIADIPIVVINQVNPIFVNFTVPQQYLPDIKRYMAQKTLAVSATVPNDPGPPLQGKLSFVDNSVDVTTGTIHLRGTFENTQNRLWPGLYADVSLTLSEESNSTVLPSQAVVTSQQGSYVYVVKADRTVEQRAVVMNRTVDGDAVIEKGVAPGEMIVTDGQTNLVPGSKIAIKNPDAGQAAQPAENRDEASGASPRLAPRAQ
jgi:multidrug efflux system membrane fusion protein